MSIDLIGPSKAAVGWLYKMCAGYHAALRHVSYVESLQVLRGWKRLGQKERERPRAPKHADVEAYFTAQLQCGALKANNCGSTVKRSVCGEDPPRAAVRMPPGFIGSEVTGITVKRLSASHIHQEMKTSIWTFKWTFILMPPRVK